MTINDYISYHEAGHAIAIHQSIFFNIQKAEVTSKGSNVKPCMKNENQPSSPRLHLEESIIAISGLVAGHEFLTKKGATNFDLQGGAAHISASDSSNNPKSSEINCSAPITAAHRVIHRTIVFVSN